MVYFAETILQAQRTTMKHVEFYIAKTKFYDQLRGKLKARQEKMIARMFEEGVDGWKARTERGELHPYHEGVSCDGDS